MWTGAELLALGRVGAGSHARLGGAAYNPKTGRWRRLAASPLPAADLDRRGDRAAELGPEWFDGGEANPWPERVHTNGIYDPATDRCRPIPRLPSRGSRRATPGPGPSCWSGAAPPARTAWMAVPAPTGWPTGRASGEATSAPGWSAQVAVTGALHQARAVVAVAVGGLGVAEPGFRPNPSTATS